MSLRNKIQIGYKEAPVVYKRIGTIKIKFKRF